MKKIILFLLALIPIIIILFIAGELYQNLFA